MPAAFSPYALRASSAALSSGRNGRMVRSPTQVSAIRTAGSGCPPPAGACMTGTGAAAAAAGTLLFLSTKPPPCDRPNTDYQRAAVSGGGNDAWRRDGWPNTPNKLGMSGTDAMLRVVVADRHRQSIRAASSVRGGIRLAGSTSVMESAAHN